MRKIRNLHLWIGLFTSLLILIEAITGLLMLEPWLMGINNTMPEQREMHRNQGMGQAIAEDIEEEEMVSNKNFRPAGQRNSMLGIVKSLHTGRIGNTDVSLLLDIVAIGLIILTVTGMIMSIRALKVRGVK